MYRNHTTPPPSSPRGQCRRSCYPPTQAYSRWTTTNLAQAFAATCRNAAEALPIPPPPPPQPCPPLSRHNPACAAAAAGPLQRARVAGEGPSWKRPSGPAAQPQGRRRSHSPWRQLVRRQLIHPGQRSPRGPAVLHRRQSSLWSQLVRHQMVRHQMVRHQLVHRSTAPTPVPQPARRQLVRRSLQSQLVRRQLTLQSQQAWHQLAHRQGVPPPYDFRRRRARACRRAEM